MSELIRVGEGHYLPQQKLVPAEYREVIESVLHNMRQVTHQLFVNGIQGDVSLLSWVQLARDQEES